MIGFNTCSRDYFICCNENKQIDCERILYRMEYEIKLRNEMIQNEIAKEFVD